MCALLSCYYTHTHTHNTYIHTHTHRRLLPKPPLQGSKVRAREKPCPLAKVVLSRCGVMCVDVGVGVFV